MLPVLTAYEKEHISERQPLPERYLGLSDEEMDAPHRGRAGDARPPRSSSSAITISATK